MDPRVRQFRQQARELNHGRVPQGRRYSRELHRLALAIVADRRRQGGQLQDVARALGLAPQVLSRWQKEADLPRPGWRPVTESDASGTSTAPTPGLVLVTRQGHRLEGLGVTEAIQILRDLA
jgi:transposase-like protein